MRAEQEAHLAFLKEVLVAKLDAKYRKGAKEHKGDLQNLTPVQLNQELNDELIDAFVYCLTLLDKIIELQNDRDNRGSTFQGKSTVC